MIAVQTQFMRTGIFCVCAGRAGRAVAQWLTDSRPRGRGFEPHQCHCVASLSKNINPSLVLVQPRKTCPFITEKLLIGPKESNKQTGILTV